VTDPSWSNAREGDADAFGVLVERHHRAALRAAVTALGAVDEADDAVQEAWIAARDRLAGFRGEAAFRTWLLAIVWHKAADRRRGVGRWLRRLVSMDEGGRGAAAGVPSIAFTAGGPSPERAALDTEQQRTIARLVRALPPKLRDPLLLVGSGDYSYDDVAAMLRTPVGTVKWRVSEARRQLRVLLWRIVRIPGADVVNRRLVVADAPQQPRGDHLGGGFGRHLGAPLPAAGPFDVHAHAEPGAFELDDLVGRRRIGGERLAANPPEQIAIGLRGPPELSRLVGGDGGGRGGPDRRVTGRRDADRSGEDE
jgi:RNA polymerase sigma-70 factor (ECF subfamily)